MITACGHLIVAIEGPLWYGECMVAAPGIIPTRSKTHAQEWSLVLLSQGIESVIEREEETGQWYLGVDPVQFSRALQTLRQYIAENKKVPRGQKPPPKLIFDWGNTWFFALLAVLFILNGTAAPGLNNFGVMDRGLFLAGEWWRPFTAVLLHKDPPHLMANLVIGSLFLGLASGIFGAGRAFLISFSAGAFANIAKCFLYPNPPPGLGASGMAMGALGLLTASSVIEREDHGGSQTLLRGCAAGILLLVLLGFSHRPHIDVFAHMIGFLAGFALGLVSLLLAGRLKMAGSPAV